MGHHGSDEPSPEMLGALRALKEKVGDDRDTLRKELLSAESQPKLGATGQFPDGSIDKSDEGKIAFGVASHRGKVIINFGKPVAWLGLDARQATALAAVL